MTKTLHAIYVWSMVLITVAVTVYLAYIGLDYYRTPIEERYFHPHNDWFKPSGAMGHGLGIIGTLMILFGVAIYIARKRYNLFSRFIRLKYLLEFHIFLCTLGPILVLFHTTFKFGGIVSVAFWSMVMVVLSGVVGRFIYIQIPRTIEGRELGLNEVKELKNRLAQQVEEKVSGAPMQVRQRLYELLTGDVPSGGIIAGYWSGWRQSRVVSGLLRRAGLTRSERKLILDAFRQERALGQKIKRLERMQELFKLWHVVHLPFALIMLVIVLIHIGVTLALGYKWIF